MSSIILMFVIISVYHTVFIISDNNIFCPKNYIITIDMNHLKIRSASEQMIT